jgi:putative tryptophan/tyrosine transport system substrate-binding protein
MWTASGAIAIMALAVGGAGGADDARPFAVAVLSTSGIPAYRTAVAGIEAGFKAQGARSPALFELISDDDLLTVERLRCAKPQVLVTVGSSASALAASLGIPYFSTMVLKEDAVASVESKEPLSTVTLDIAPKAVFTRIRRLFPTRRRIAVLRQRGQLEPAAEELRSEAAALGLSLELVDCDSPKELLCALRKLRGRADLVWCLPNRALYEPALVHALILVSIRQRLPLVGFSEAFVKAGALVGFLPDYRDIGDQAAALVLAYRSGQPLGRKEHPRNVRTMVNERVARVLGIEIKAGPGEVEFVK